MNDVPQGKKELIVDDGHDAGDDNALQTAMLANLEKQLAEQTQVGNDEEAQGIQDDIDALKVLMAHDAQHDPHDKNPDDLSVL